MPNMLGRPLDEALKSLPEGMPCPRIVETAAPARNGQVRQEGTLRVISCREGEWIVARFVDRQPREAEEA